MKLSVLQETLKKGLDIIAPAVATRSTLPVLSNVALVASDNLLRLSAMDLEISITTLIGALVDEPGGVTLPARLLRDLVAALPKERIGMTLNDKTQIMRAVCGRTDAKVKGIALDEFPGLPAPKGEPSFTLPVGDMRQLIKSVLHAAATDIGRPVLTGVSLRLENQQIEAAATDGFRLAIRREPIETNATISALVPGRALASLLQVMKGEDDDEMVQVFVREDSAQVYFLLPGAGIAAQTIEANYPDYKKIVPSSYLARYVMSAFDLGRALRTVLMFAVNDLVRLAVSEVDPVLAVDAEGAETGDARATIDVQEGGGMKGAELAINGQFLLESLAALDAPEVALEFSGKGRPLVLRPAHGDQGLQVIMPMTAR